MSGSESAAPHCWAVGDSVVIADHSEAHGDKGRVDYIQANGIILVELEQGCIWPVTADELKPNGLWLSLGPEARLRAAGLKAPAAGWAARSADQTAASAAAR